MKYIVCRGNPIDGFEYIGPFDSRCDAIHYMDQEQYKENQWIVELLTPSEG